MTSESDPVKLKSNLVYRYAFTALIYSVMIFPEIQVEGLPYATSQSWTSQQVYILWASICKCFLKFHQLDYYYLLLESVLLQLELRCWFICSIYLRRQLNQWRLAVIIAMFCPTAPAVIKPSLNWLSALQFFPRKVKSQGVQQPNPMLVHLSYVEVYNEEQSSFKFLTWLQHRLREANLDGVLYSSILK